MDGHPRLKTERLILRGFRLADAAEVQRLAGEREIAATTAAIPHPYADGVAEEWIRSRELEYREGKGVYFAITRRSDRVLAGTVSLTIRREHHRAELGYWIGKPYWNQGYATEAARAVLRHGFESLGLNRIFACHFRRNPASGRVLQKLGMRHEGSLRSHFRKWDEHQDLEMYGMLKDEYRALAGGGGTTGEGRSER